MMDLANLNREIKIWDENSIKMEDSIEKLEDTLKTQTKKFTETFYQSQKGLLNEICELENLKTFIMKGENFERTLKIDMDRFSGVINKTEELLLDIKCKVQEIRVEFKEKLIPILKIKGKVRGKVAKLSPQLLSSRQTSQSFHYAVMKPGQRYKCIACNEPITIHSPYLRHMEEYPAGSNILKPHWYHASKACLIGRGFQYEYLRDSKVVSEVEVGDTTIRTLADCGFDDKNLRATGDSDNESNTSEPKSQMRQEPITNFVYKRKDNRSGERFVCVACHSEIRPDSYLCRGNEYGAPVHIARQCIESATFGPVDFTKVKCFVTTLLRNYNELRHLFDCGFQEHGIIGQRPQHPPTKDFSPGPRPVPPIAMESPSTHPSKPNYFIYRRNDAAIKPSVVCIACKAVITQPCFVTQGDTFARPVHIRRQCIRSLDSTQLDFSKAKCKIFSLLKSFEEMQNLLSCGFYYNNLIGVRPQNPNYKSDPARCAIKEPSPAATKDVGFIFNEEPFCCQRLIRGERCEGCLQAVKKGEWSLRHKERIPREKLREYPLVSQFYHASKTCLVKRGFTEKYLEYVLCEVELGDQESSLSVMDVLVRCGLASENIKCQVTQDNPTQVPMSSLAPPLPPAPVPRQDGPSQWYMFIVNCARAGCPCGGCGFDISVNEPCFLYNTSSAQDNAGGLVHIDRVCVRSRFSEADLGTLVCINNNSMADVTAERIVGTGVVNIMTRLPPRKAGRSAGSVLRPRVKHHMFIVDCVRDPGAVCAACHRSLQGQQCVLQAISAIDDTADVLVHLTDGCVRQAGYYGASVASCDVLLSVAVPEATRALLDSCGFKSIL